MEDKRKTYLTPEQRREQAKRILALDEKSGIRGWYEDRVYDDIRSMALRDYVDSLWCPECDGDGTLDCLRCDGTGKR